MNKNFAIVIVPGAAHSTPPDPAPNTGCAYQVKINSDTWQCLTQQEWDARQAQQAQEQVQEEQNFDNIVVPIFSLWPWYVGVIIVVIVLNRLWRWKHPRSW